MKAGKPFECLCASVTTRAPRTQIYISNRDRLSYYQKAKPNLHNTNTRTSLFGIWEDNGTFWWSEKWHLRCCGWVVWSDVSVGHKCRPVLLALTCIIQCRMEPQDAQSTIRWTDRLKTRAQGREESAVPPCPALKVACYLSVCHLRPEYLMYTPFVPGVLLCSCRAMLKRLL